MTHTLINGTVHLMDIEFVDAQFVAIVGKLEMNEVAAFGSAELSDYDA